MTFLAVDTNVLVYAHRREVAEHESARTVVTRLAEGKESWAIPWPCVFEFWSVVTNRRIWKDAASTPSQALEQLEAWRGSPTLRFIGETDGFWPAFASAAARPRVSGPVIHDARVAAICVAHGVDALLSRDRDFSLFPDLVVRNPFRQ